MAKLTKKSEESQNTPNDVKQSRLKKIVERKDKAAKANIDNPLLSSVPLHMQSTMQFINERNEKAKESPNYGKISENRINSENELSDHDIFKNFFQR